MRKYGIQLKNLYNFSETGFIINIIITSFIIIYSEKHEKAKTIQPNNQE